MIRRRKYNVYTYALPWIRIIQKFEVIYVRMF